MEFQFPATALKEQPGCSIDSICFAQETMLRFRIESVDALVIDDWYAICAVILKKVEDMQIFLHFKKYKYWSDILSQKVFTLYFTFLLLQMHSDSLVISLILTLITLIVPLKVVY